MLHIFLYFIMQECKSIFGEGLLLARMLSWDLVDEVGFELFKKNEWG